MTGVDGSDGTSAGDPRPGNASRSGDGPRSGDDDTGAADSDGFGRMRAVINELGRRVERLETTVADVAADVEASNAADVDDDGTMDRLDAMEAEFDEQIEDLRDRVVRLHRDVERTAAGDHTHSADHESTLDDHESSLEAREDTLDGLAERVDDLDEEREDVRAKLSRVASAVVRTQKRLTPVERHVAEQRRLAELTATANAESIYKASCEDCGGTVRLTLLSTPECPHCECRFRDLEPSGGFFGTATLRVGDPPALTGDVDDASLHDEPAEEGPDR